MEVNRDLSNWIWNNPHIDDMQKAWLQPLVRGKEEIIAQLEAELKQLKEDCKPFQAQIDQRKTYTITTPKQISGNF